MIKTKLLPEQFGPLKGFNGYAQEMGACGDTMEFWIIVKNQRIINCTYTTDGCGHSILCGAITAIQAINKDIHDAMNINPQDILNIAGNSVSEDSKHCAVLATKTLKEAIKDYSKQCNEGINASATQDLTLDDALLIHERLTQIKKIIVVLSGKGGVGKTTFAVNLASFLAKEGYATGLLDIDIHGPSTPMMLGIIDQKVKNTGEYLLPVDVGPLKVMSMGLLIKKRDDAIVWRGPMKSSAIKEFISHVEWGPLDYLIIDSPPGTGDEPLMICQLLEPKDGAVIITTPQEVATEDVRKTVSFCRKTGTHIIGIVENMSGFTCHHCGKVTSVFPKGGGKEISQNYQIPYLGAIPLEPEIGISCDQGNPFINKSEQTEATNAFKAIIKQLI